MMVALMPVLRTIIELAPVTMLWLHQTLPGIPIYTGATM